MDSRKFPKGLIGFEGLKISCIIGILPQERITPQDLVIDLKVAFDTCGDALKDDTTPRIDYTVLADIVTREVKFGHYQLIEALASEVLDLVDARYDLDWAWIRVRKPAAIPGAACAILELERDFNEEDG